MTIDSTQRNADLPDDSTPATDWWRNAVVYQIYVRSFAVWKRRRHRRHRRYPQPAPYLAQLGVDAIWVNPWYESPLNNGGYDVADYRSIDPRYGTVADAETLIRKAKQVGIRVLVDLVANHTSSAAARPRLRATGGALIRRPWRWPARMVPRSARFLAGVGCP